MGLECLLWVCYACKFCALRVRRLGFQACILCLIAGGLLVLVVFGWVLVCLWVRVAVVLGFGIGGW